MPIVYRDKTVRGPRSSSSINVWGTLRSLEVGESVPLPPELHDSIRSNASRMKFMGLCISVHVDRSRIDPVVVATREA